MIPTKRRLWAGALLAPAAWVFGEYAGYYLAARSCARGTPGVPLAGASNPMLADTGLEVFAALVAGLGLFIAIGNWRATRDSADSGGVAAGGRARFMAFTSVMTSSLLLFGIVLFGFGSLVVDSCRQAR